MNALTLHAVFFVVEFFFHFWTKKLGQFCISRVNSTNFANFVVKFRQNSGPKKWKKKNSFHVSFLVEHQVHKSLQRIRERKLANFIEWGPASIQVDSHCLMWLPVLLKCVTK